MHFAFPFARSKSDVPGDISTAGELLYAIGDVHGRADLLARLVRLIDSDACSLGMIPTLIFLGDYVDRGPQSSQVLDLLIHLNSTQKCRMLLGNHEQSLLRFLEDSAIGPFWTSFGGAQTLQSYGVRAPLNEDSDSWECARVAFSDALPLKHRQFLTKLELCAQVGDYFFVHAGVRPKVPLDAQNPEDLLWIRGEFLEAVQPFPKIVVHGHSPGEEPYSGTWRIGVDTGAYATGVLTAVKLLGGQRDFIQTNRVR